MTYVPIPLPNRVKIQKNEAIKIVNDYYIHMCKRHSVRDFSKEPVSNAIIEKIIETAGSTVRCKPAALAFCSD